MLRGLCNNDALKRWGPVLLWMGLIFAMSHDEYSGNRSSLVIYALKKWFIFWGQPMPSEEWLEAVHVLVRKAAHMTEFAVLYALLRRAGLSTAKSAVFAVLYAVSDEYHQTFIPTRYGCATDVLIDSAGVALAIACEASRGLWRKLIKR